MFKSEMYIPCLNKSYFNIGDRDKIRTASNIGYATSIGTRDYMEDFVCIRHVINGRDASHIVESLEMMVAALIKKLKSDQLYYGYVEMAFKKFGFFTDEECAAIQQAIGTCDGKYEASFRNSLSKMSQQFVAVFDGHSGEECARRASEELAPLIIYTVYWAVGQYEAAIRKGFAEFAKKTSHLNSGTTANIVIATYDHIICANLGDSRAVACVRGIAVPLSVDHKPEAERERILAAGGFVDQGRLGGYLALSRAFGDAGYAGMIAIPDVKFIERSGASFVVVASDGLWDVKKNQDVIDHYKPICENFNSNMIVPIKSMDNTSIIVLVL